MRQLILFRHSKTEPFSETGTDETRRLTERGHEDARLIAKALRQLDLHPDRVLVSTARRTRETWQEFHSVFPEVSATYIENLYLADPDDIAAEIEKASDAGCVLVIGHNPGLHELALQLMEYGGTRNELAAGEIRVKFPTSAVAVFNAKEDDPFNVYNFELSEFLVPKDLRETEVA
mgnify:FL=1